MKVPKFNEGDIVWIRWEDHFHNYTAGWMGEDERKEAGGFEPVFCETVGFVLKDTGKNIALAMTASDGVSNGGYAVKIKSCITAYKLLKKAKK